MSRSTLPLFPSDEGWPYPDGTGDWADRADRSDVAEGSDPDLDDLELRVDPHAFDSLTDDERQVLSRRFGLDGGAPLSMKELGPALGCTHAEARDLLGAAIDKVRVRLSDDSDT